MCDHVCPLTAAMDAAEAVVDELGDLHENPVLARGVITAYRKSLEAMQKPYPCDGAVRDRNNEVTCPFNRLHQTAHSLATVPITRPGWAFDPEKLVDGGRQTSAGQYL
jgi:hypothetical protein